MTAFCAIAHSRRERHLALLPGESDREARSFITVSTLEVSDVNPCHSSIGKEARQKEFDTTVVLPLGLVHFWGRMFLNLYQDVPSELILHLLTFPFTEIGCNAVWTARALLGWLTTLVDD